MDNQRFFKIIAWTTILLCVNCNTNKKYIVVLEEKAGISRDLEYVKVKIPNHTENFLSLKEVSTGKLLHGEKLKEDSYFYIFPISLSAYERKIFSVTASSEKLVTSKLNIKGEGMSISVENEYFIANFHTTEEKAEGSLSPGQLATLFQKNKNVLFERDENNIHWAPNFQKNSLEYKTIGHLDNNNAKITQNNSYSFAMVKSGNVRDYEEIDLMGRYQFFSGLPYFIYSSIIEINKDVKLNLLRNDEMTMNSLFTDLIYPDSRGKASFIPLYDTVKFDSLTKSPLKDNIPWIGFINKVRGYGLVSLRLSYDNHNQDGKESPLYQPHTKISAGDNGGRYWNRRLIHDYEILVPKGSRYYERNAYLVIEDLKKINEQIEYYTNCLNNPIIISYVLE